MTDTTSDTTDSVESTDETPRCDEHPNREAAHTYDDGTQWCEACHVANLDAAAGLERGEPL